MSYGLVILQPPVPEDDASAWRFVHDLLERSPEGEVPSVFHTLIDRLTERYPCICDLPDDLVDDGVWSDGPLRDNAGHAFTHLGVSWPRVDEVRPFVVETANALGLVVFDEQLARIDRPGRGLQRTGSKQPWWKFWTRSSDA
ncbi:MAG: hypothetical protein U0835_15160 [Isosphaeraceae bacterium]